MSGKVCLLSFYCLVIDISCPSPRPAEDTSVSSTRSLSSPVSPSQHFSTWPHRISHSSTLLLTSSRHRPLLCSDGMPSTSQPSQKRAILLSTTGHSFLVCLRYFALLHASHRLSMTQHSPSLVSHLSTLPLRYLRHVRSMTSH